MQKSHSECPRIDICIPVYCWDPSPLIESLLKQIWENSLPIRIFIRDDGSPESEYPPLIKFKQFPEVHLILGEKNIGRSECRNLLAQESDAEYLIFLDADVQIIHKNFLINYTYFCQPKLVIYGGRVWPRIPPPNGYRLRWHYGRSAEQKIDPDKLWTSFKSHNFLAPRSLILSTPFASLPERYGHEDTYWGYRMQLQGIQIAHIDNPILASDQESNVDFLRKTEEGIRNCIYLENKLNDQNWDQSIQLIRLYQRIPGFLIPAGKRIAQLLIPHVRNFCLKEYGGVWMFQLYKLLLYIVLR